MGSVQIVQVAEQRGVIGGWDDRETASWSETPNSKMFRSEESIFPVMMRSSVWPRLRVGPFTCCVRCNDSREKIQVNASSHPQKV